MVRIIDGQGFLTTRKPPLPHSTSLPVSSTMAAWMPGKGSVQEPGTSGVTPGDRDTVKLDYDGTALSGYALTPQRSTTALLPQIGMELGVQQRLLFRFWQLDVPGGSTARFDALPGQHGVTYANGSPGASEHFVIVDAVDGAAQEAGTRIFGPMTVAAGAGQRITVADWPAAHALKVETDADGDGVYEKTEIFGGRSCGSADGDDNGVPDACEAGPNVYLPVIGR